MRVGILGAGVTGLSMGRFLNTHFDIEILEKEAYCGGIARTKKVNGISYHQVGGHCFNSKYPDILDFVFNEVLPLSEWRKIERNSKIRLENMEVDYPIEYSVKEIFKLNPQLAIDITADFLSSKDTGKYENLEEWFKQKFGKTLAELYFIPYNTKIWGRNLKEMSQDWVEGKLPIPNKYSFFKSLISTVSDDMPHHWFYYPISNDQNTFLDALAKGLNIYYNTPVKSIRKQENGKWLINGELIYDILINTTPLDRLPALIEAAPQNVLNAARKLKYNPISNVLWETRPTKKTWTYLPDKTMLFHRYIHIGNFFGSQIPYSISEATGKHSFEELVENGSKDKFLVKPLDYHQSEHAYVVFDDNYVKATSIIKNYLEAIGLFTVGRFGEWEYYNMDVCMKKSKGLAEKIILDFKDKTNA